MPECKWCLSFDSKTVWPKPGHPDTKFSCSNPKGLDEPAPTDSCEHFEVFQELVDKLEEDARDILSEQEDLRRGYG